METFGKTLLAIAGATLAGHPLLQPLGAVLLLPQRQLQSHLGLLRLLLLQLQLQQHHKLLPHLRLLTLLTHSLTSINLL
jgi:hypothetical protein